MGQIYKEKQMVYLVKENGAVKSFYSEKDMISAGFKKADRVVTDEEFNSNGCYARIINGEIIVGRLPEEIEAEERNERIAEIDGELSEIDKKQARSSAEITEALICNEQPTEETIKYHLERQERVKQLRAERKQYATD